MFTDAYQFVASMVYHFGIVLQKRKGNFNLTPTVLCKWLFYISRMGFCYFTNLKPLKYYISRMAKPVPAKFLISKISTVCGLMQDESGATPLHRCIHIHHQSCVRLLLEHGANPVLCNFELQTPLFDAAGKGFFW